MSLLWKTVEEERRISERGKRMTSGFRGRGEEDEEHGKRGGHDGENEEESARRGVP